MRVKMLDLSIGHPPYEVEVQASLLFEAVLGLAAVTYVEIRDTLERKTPEWEEILGRMAPEAQQEVEYCARHNTWQALLRLLHGGEFAEIGAFLAHLRLLTVEELRYQVLPPFGGPREEELRRLAASGDKQAANILIEAAAGNGFLAAYVPFFLYEDGEALKRHMLLLMESWYAAAIRPSEAEWAEILRREVKSKQEMQARMSREAFVEGTIGKPYLPDPGVRRVLLVPNIAYRPWMIQADLPGTRVFYFPVSDESLYGDDDPYRPPAALVLLHKALGDENRLRILKLLVAGERSLQELTGTLELAKSTIHHHLALLRSAGLVVSNGSTYVLRPALLQQMDDQLAAYLERADRGC